MAKIQNTPPSYWPPLQERRGYQVQINAYGPMLSRLTLRRAPGPSPLFRPYWHATGINIVAWRRALQKRFSSFWKTDLTNAERTLWRLQAAIITIVNYKGKTITPTGHGLFMFYSTHDAHRIPWYPKWPTDPAYSPRRTPPSPWNRPNPPTLTTVDTSGPDGVYINTSDTNDFYATGIAGHLRPAPNFMPRLRPGQYFDCDIWTQVALFEPWFFMPWPNYPALLPRGKSWTVGLRWTRRDNGNTSDPSWISFTY